MLHRPFFSICVPTRNRADTLHYCLKSLIDQDFDNYEIIVSDNSDEDYATTKEVVSELASPKIKYFRQNTVIGMTENYEFAVDKAIGEYIICIGDDDGIVKNSLTLLYHFIKKHQCNVVKCPVVSYAWKGNIFYPNSEMSYPKSNGIAIMNSMSVLQKVFSFELEYFNLPMIYYGAINRSVIEKIKAIQGSVFANTTSIDMYSGMCIAYLEKEYYISDFPFCISGASAKSNGNILTSKKKGKSEELANEFIKLSKVNDTYILAKVPAIHSSLECTTWVNLSLFKLNFNINPSELNINALKCFLKLKNKNNIWNNSKIDNKELDNKFIEAGYNNLLETYASNYENNMPFYFSNSSFNVGFKTDREIIDPLLFGIENVYDVAILSEKIRANNNELTPILLNKNLLASHQWRVTKKQMKYHFIWFLKVFKDYVLNK